MIRAAIFDMDGTLVDNTDVHVRAFEVFGARYGVAGWREKLKSVLGMGNEDIFRRLLPESLILEKGVQALADEKEAIYREIYAPGIVPIAGLVPLLERLRDAGVRCAVGSSGCRANVDFVLEKCGIAEFFEVKICGDMVSHCKPDPEIYSTAVATLGMEPAECLVFEDAVAGIESARRAGIGRIVALATTLGRDELARLQGPSVIVSDYRELQDLRTLLQ
ncbi:MAG: HAD family phosphatase [Alistipes senegalensis]|nr:HAD family phosphatase [Bacteroides cellulosilyticus]MCM1352250.1 HAD family phosphatase [Alistipes senegalensis]